jgi:hypothetical protein
MKNKSKNPYTLGLSGKSCKSLGLRVFHVAARMANNQYVFIGEKKEF